MRTMWLGWMCLVLAAPAWAGGKDPELKARVEALETEVAQLRAEHDELVRILRRAMPTPEDEEAAAMLFGQAIDAMEARRTEEAMGLLVKVMDEYPATEAGQAAPRVAAELAVVGRPVKLAVSTWLQGEVASFDGLTLVVFWEAWCPHCQREVPALAAQYATYQAAGVQVLGVTRVTRGLSDADATTFLTEHAVTFPNAKEDGSMADAFGVEGIPAAALVKDGTIVWRGHPGQLSPEFVATFQ